MKRFMAVLLLALGMLAVLCGVCGCSRSMDYIIANEPRMDGTVISCDDRYICIRITDEDYPEIIGLNAYVSLDVECGDSMTSFSVGDDVAVYFNGVLSDSNPIYLNEVYAITLMQAAKFKE